MSNDFWQNLTEDEVWALATDLNCPVEVREAAMRRWLFPEEYAYAWAHERIDNARELLRKQHTEQRESEQNAA